MGVDFISFIAIDDSTPSQDPPFTHDASIWSFAEDYALCANGCHAFFAALGYQGFGSKHPVSEFELRGVPTFFAAASEARRKLEIEDYVGWLESEELFDALRQAEIHKGDLPKAVMVFLDTVKHLQESYGADRIRIAFTFIP